MLLLDDVPTTRKVFHRVHLASRHYLALPRCPLFRAEKKGDPVLETGPVAQQSYWAIPALRSLAKHVSEKHRW